jgi:hypothetical protein
MSWASFGDGGLLPTITSILIILEEPDWASNALGDIIVRKKRKESIFMCYD